MSDTLGCNETSTGDPCYYSTLCQFLVPLGWACLSLDLPSHGANIQKGEPEGIAGWRWRVDKGQDFVAQNNAAVADSLSWVKTHLGDKIRTDADIVIAGISRGGFLAGHYAVTDSRVSTVGLFSPVTNLSLLTEFSSPPESAAVQRILRPLDLATETTSAELATKNVWAIIGDRDTRVGTDSLVQLMRKMQCSGCTQIIPGMGCTGCPARSTDNQMRVEYEPKGHTVPPSTDPASTFKTASDWVLAHTPGR
jgi:pimeloyl-ACP methyl ester carboxylesterase